MKVVNSTRQEASEADAKKIYTKSDVKDQREDNKDSKEQIHMNCKVCRMVRKYSSYYKKNGTLRICIDFRDLNISTSRDEYPMHVAEMLVDLVTCFEYFKSFRWLFWL